MKTNVGLWVDHRRAVILAISDGEEEVQVILSHADRQPGRIEGERPATKFESLQVPADDVKDRKFEHHLNTYYDEIIACVHDAKELLIFGPGEAKGEFKKRLEKEKPGGRIVTVETTDKMTDRQITAKVREFFLQASPVIVLP
jgi:stalled ribosome rescue protein Dom34